MLGFTDPLAGVFIDLVFVCPFQCLCHLFVGAAHQKLFSPGGISMSLNPSEFIDPASIPTWPAQAS